MELYGRNQKGDIQLNSASNTQSARLQLRLFDTIKDFLLVPPVFLLELITTCILLILIFHKDKTIPKFRVSVASLIFYYYLCVMLTNIVDLPCRSEFIRLSGLGKSFNCLPCIGQRI